MIVTKEEAKKLWLIKGKRKSHSKGYIRLLCPNHPNANKEGYVYEHTYVISLNLKRGLLKQETVHHKDGIVSNNRIDNLQLLSHSDHRKFHPRPSIIGRPKCKICDIPIPYNSRTGFCVKHYWDYIRNTYRPCKVQSCLKQAGFRSGMCRKHINDFHNKKNSKGKKDDNQYRNC